MYTFSFLYFFILSNLFQTVLLQNVCDTFKQHKIVITKNNDQIQSFRTSSCLTGTKYSGAVKIEGQQGEVISEFKKGTFTNFAQLKGIYFERNSITSLSPGSFSNLPRLQYISLPQNKIRSIRKGVFNHMPISYLVLNYNNIRLIETDALDDLPNLEVLYLIFNDLVFWYKDYLKHSTKLKLLNLTRNKLKELARASFKNTPNLHILNLSENQIATIHKEAFEGLTVLNEINLCKNRLKRISSEVFLPTSNLELVFLNGNNLTFISDELLSNFKQLKAFSANNNPLQCPCMEKVRNWAYGNNIDLDKYYSECIFSTNPVCVQPTENVCEDRFDEDLVSIFFENFEQPPLECDSFYVQNQ